MIITGASADVALLIGQMVKMGLPEVWTDTSHSIGRSGDQLGVDSGDLVGLYVTEGDLRKVSVEAYFKGMRHTLSHLTHRASIRWTLVTIAVSHLLTHLSKLALLAPAFNTLGCTEH